MGPPQQSLSKQYRLANRFVAFVRAGARAAELWADATPPKRLRIWAIAPPLWLAGSAAGAPARTQDLGARPRRDPRAQSIQLSAKP